MRMAHSGKGSQHVFQSPQMAGMILWGSEI